MKAGRVAVCSQVDWHSIDVPTNIENHKAGAKPCKGRKPRGIEIDLITAYLQKKGCVTAFPDLVEELIAQLDRRDKSGIAPRPRAHIASLHRIMP